MIVHCDGAITQNPGGTASYGYVLEPVHGEIMEGKGIIGHGAEMTVNVAEYVALIEALKHVVTLADEDEGITVYLDSDIVVGGMNGRYSHKKAPHLARLRDQAKAIIYGRFVKFRWIPREENTYADRLAEEALRKDGLSYEEASYF